MDERALCMEALFNQESLDAEDQPESIRNMLGRYRDIDEHFPDELRGAALPYFLDWLIENVHMVEITAFSDEDAYTIFETMNDRGLSLSPTDMLKGYLLANITDEQRRVAASQVWKDRITELVELGKDEDADFFKSWFRSQYARRIRERRRGAAPQDFDRIGTEFHRWIRENRQDIGLTSSMDFARFIQRDLAFYARQYERLRQASTAMVPELASIYYIAQLGFTLQYPLLLAPLSPDDPGPVIERKLRVVASYLDILLARRLWNWRSISYSTMQYAMFLVTRDIRGRSPEGVADVFTTRLAEDTETFARNDRFDLNKMNRPAIHWLLARMTDYVERESGLPSRFVDYMNQTSGVRYEVEHIWPTTMDYSTDFSSAADFQEYRNRIGGLLLLPKKFNASFGDLPYEQKLEHYYGQNLLAQSLHPRCYSQNPGFRQFVDRTGLLFRAHPEFRRQDLDDRQALYRALAEEVWNPARLARDATS